MTDRYRIICPHCGFDKEVPAAAIPVGTVRATCPRCRRSFPLEPAPPEPAGYGETVAAEEPVFPPASPAIAEAPLLPPPTGPDPTDGETSRNAAPQSGAAATGGRIAPFAEIFSRSWDIYRNRIGILVLLYFLTILLLLAPIGVFLGIGGLASLGAPDSKTVFLAGGGLAGGLVGLCAMFWGVAALICAVTDRRLGIREALEQGWERYLSFCWLFTIGGFITIGGYLLFIVPGVIFTVWFIFAKYIVASGEERGMGALLLSREYVRGYWFDVFGRLIVVWLISALIGWIPIVGGILSLLFVPFSMIFSLVLFDDLRQVRGEVRLPAQGGERFWILTVGALGYLLLPFLIILIAGASLMSILFN